MTRRLATMFFMAVFLIGPTSPSVQADNSRLTRDTLKGISAVYVMVETLSEGAKTLGLTSDAIQNDVELKLRLAGMRVITQAEGEKQLGSPAVYVNVNVADDARAAYINVELQQNARLERSGIWTPPVTTWSVGVLVSKPTSQDIRDFVKDHVDQFLNAWLSVNPKK